MKKISLITFVVSLLSFIIWLSIVIAYMLFNGYSPKLAAWQNFGFCFTFLVCITSLLVYLFTIRDKVKEQLNHFINS